MSGTISKVWKFRMVVVENNKVGDYVFFDDTNTSGAGAQGVISHLEGVDVLDR